MQHGEVKNVLRSMADGGTLDEDIVALLMRNFDIVKGLRLQARTESAQQYEELFKGR